MQSRKKWRQNRRIRGRKKGCWYSLYKCKLDRHFLRCARYFNLVCKNDTATNKKAERDTVAAAAACPLFCQLRQKQQEQQLAIWPRSDSGPGPSFVPFRILVVVIFKSKTRLHQKGLTMAGMRRGYGNFSAVEFLCENVKRLESTRTHTHTKYQKAAAKNCNKNPNKRQMTAI